MHTDVHEHHASSPYGEPSVGPEHIEPFEQHNGLGLYIQPFHRVASTITKNRVPSSIVTFNWRYGRLMISPSQRFMWAIAMDHPSFGDSANAVSTISMNLSTGV
jgi:hypothetical protein